MVSRRYRANRSIGNKINNIDTRVSVNEKTGSKLLDTSTVTGSDIASNAVTNDNLAPDSVTDSSLIAGSVGAASLGVINEIQSDSSLNLIFGPGGNLYLEGDQYPFPPAETVIYLTYDSTGKVVTGPAVDSSGGVSGPISWSAITDKPTTFPSIWSDITGIPSTFAPSGHVHQASDIVGGTANGQVLTWNGSVATWTAPAGSYTPADASTTDKGVVQLATVAETLAGIDTNKVVTPADVAAVAATKANLNQTYVGIDTDGIPFFDPGLDFTNAVPLYPDTDGVPYLSYDIPVTP